MAGGSVLRRAYVEVLPDTKGFDPALTEALKKGNPGGKFGKQLGGQLNRALSKLDIPALDVKADPKDALAAINAVENKLRGMAKSAETVEVKVQTERALSQVQRFRKQLGDLGDDAEQAGEEAGKGFGSQLNKALADLDVKPIDINADPAAAFAAIEATEQRLQELSRDSATIEIKAKTEQARSELEKFKKQLGEAGDDGAQGFGARFVARLGPVLASAPVSGPLAVAAAAAAPVVAGVLSAAVIGGAGIGGVVGGLLLVKDDPRVKQAGAQLGETLLGSLKEDAGAFVQPVLAAVDKIEYRFLKLRPTLQHIFDKSSTFIGPLLDGTLDGVEGILRGVDKLITEADPVIDALGDSFRILGDSAGLSLSIIAGGSDDAAKSLKALSYVIGGSVVATGLLIRGLTEVGGFVIDRLQAKWHDLTDGTVLAADATEKAVATQQQMAAVTPAATSAIRDYLKATHEAAVANGALVATQEDVAAKQAAVIAAQDGYKKSLDALGPSAGQASALLNGLRTATTNLYGAQETAIDANEGYQESWDNLSASVKVNGGTLNAHSAAGRDNRNALEDVLIKTRDLYFAEIATGSSVADATKKHQDRINKLKEEAAKNKLNKDETNKLIATYGQIPKKKTTDLVLDGLNKVAKALTDLYVFQRSLATGRSIASVETEIRKGSDSGPAKRYGGYHDGGRTAMVGEYEPAGIVHGKEFVFDAATVRQVDRQAPGFLDEVHATGQLPGYAGGGYVAPVDTSKRWPFATDVTGTRIPSRAEVASKVPFAFGNWPSSPSAQRGDSGVWRSVVALIKSTGPLSGSFGNAYRPGDPKWHGSGRAVDWMGFNQDALASFLAARRPLELIHRTRNRDYAYTRGKNKGSFNNSLMEAHRNHVHIAMDDGGMRMLQPGMNLIPNGTGRPEPIAGPAAMAAMGGNAYHLTVNVPATAHPAETGRQIVLAIQSFEQNNGARWRGNGS